MIDTSQWEWEPEVDGGDIRWRTKFLIEHGFEPREAYDLALSFAGLR